VAAVSGGFLSLAGLGGFRVRRLGLAIPGLPRGLEGATIAHVSDPHVGKFSRGDALARVADATNALEADLVLFTGDLIDLSLADLDEGIAFVKRLDPRRGLFLCEGNHDLIEDGPEFRRRVLDAGLPLLLDRGQTVLVRDEPVQVLGLSWSREGQGMADGVRALRGRRAPEAFPILLAHHPHAFDYAPGFPLVLSGHTHGGLLNLTDRIGAGPFLYRYWSGAYEKDGRTVVVSNGVGTWFPLRVNAPAEILQLTLHGV
jgi:predicted MPP superfamily phosphohydrolase